MTLYVAMLQKRGQGALEHGPVRDKSPVFMPSFSGEMLVKLRLVRYSGVGRTFSEVQEKENKQGVIETGS